MTSVVCFATSGVNIKHSLFHGATTKRSSIFCSERNIPTNFTNV